MIILQNPFKTKSLLINFASMCKLKVVSFFSLCKICSKIFFMILKNHLKTLKCINRTTTLAKKSQKIYSIYNYIQKHNSKEKNLRQMHHPRSFAALLAPLPSGKNTSQIMRAIIPTSNRKLCFEVSNLLLLSPSFLSFLIPKHLTRCFNLLCYK